MVTGTDALSVGAGVLLSALFSYWPGLRVWYAAKDNETKRLIMLGCLVVVAVLSLSIGCWLPELSGLIGIVATCDRAGVLNTVRAFLLAAVFNQGAYGLSPQLPDAKAAEAAGDAARSSTSSK